jgi:hypothetical protein
MREHEVTAGSAQASTTIVATIIDQRQDPPIKRMTFHLQREQPMSVLFTRVQRTNECVALACTYLSHVTGLTCVLPHNTPGNPENACAGGRDHNGGSLSARVKETVGADKG